MKGPTLGKWYPPNSPSAHPAIPATMTTTARAPTSYPIVYVGGAGEVDPVMFRLKVK